MNIGFRLLNLKVYIFMTLFTGLCKLSFLPPYIMGLQLRSGQHGVRVPCPLMAVCSF